MDQSTKVLIQIDFIAWVVQRFILLMKTRIYLTMCLGLIQLFKLPLALNFLFERNDEGYKEEGNVTNFASLCTALADTTFYIYVLYQS